MYEWLNINHLITKDQHAEYQRMLANRFIEHNKLIRNNHVLAQNEWNHYSQNGEDGVIQILLNDLRLEKGFFVEFGAWDGKYLSNTFNLINMGWKGLYIESDLSRFQSLQRTKEEFPGQIEILNKTISYDNKNSLNYILPLLKTLPQGFDILSIDVDGEDYYIWEDLKNYAPKIVIIECNSAIMPPYEHLHNSKLNGSSFMSIASLGKIKNYKLIWHTGNSIFVHNDLINKISFEVLNTIDLFKFICLKEYNPIEDCYYHSWQNPEIK